jgi:hypothetical protein
LQEGETATVWRLDRRASHIPGSIIDASVGLLQGADRVVIGPPRVVFDAFAGRSTGCTPHGTRPLPRALHGPRRHRLVQAVDGRERARRKSPTPST